MSEAARLASIVGADGSSPLLHTDPHDWEASQATGRADSLAVYTDWESGVTTRYSLRGTHWTTMIRQHLDCYAVCHCGHKETGSMDSAFQLLTIAWQASCVYSIQFVAYHNSFPGKHTCHTC